MDIIDLRPTSHRAFAAGAEAVKPALAALNTPALVREARTALAATLAAHTAAGDTEGIWQTKGAQRALRDHAKTMR
jgi:hypothetical protein